MLTLRQATEQDRDFCWNLHRQTMQGYVEATWGWDEADQIQRFDSSFNPSRTQILEWNRQPIGLLVVDQTGVPVKIFSIEIAPEHQNKGYGTILISSIIEQATHRPVWLQVLKVNPAKNLYRRLGFVVVGETSTHWQMVIADGSYEAERLRI